MTKKISFTKHAAYRIQERDIGFKNVEHVIKTGFKTTASKDCLAILGTTETGRFLKAVVAITDKIINVITVYPVRKERTV